MKILGILVMEGEDVSLIPIRSKPTVEVAGTYTGGIVDTPSPEQDAISKEVKKDYSLEGRLKKAK